MIKYESNQSPFYLANKAYCEAIEEKLKAMNTEASGYCNSYGYDLELRLNRANLTYTIKCQKHQTTQNGVIIPVNANNYSGMEIVIDGLDKKYTVVIGESKLMRLITQRALKEKIPPPYFIKINRVVDIKQLEELTNKILNNGISRFRLKGGKLIMKVHLANSDPLSFVESFENIVLHWK